MVDIGKQIDYWRTGSGEDWEVACELVDAGHARHGLFFAHLALEKMLKAHVCRETNNLAPKIHNLVRLAELGNLPITTEQRTFLGFFNQYQIEGRYPDQLPPSPDRDAAKKHLKQAQEILKWLTHQF